MNIVVQIEKKQQLTVVSALFSHEKKDRYDLIR